MEFDVQKDAPHIKSGRDVIDRKVSREPKSVKTILTTSKSVVEAHRRTIRLSNEDSRLPTPVTEAGSVLTTIVGHLKHLDGTRVNPLRHSANTSPP